MVFSFQRLMITALLVVTTFILNGCSDFAASEFNVKSIAAKNKAALASSSSGAAGTSCTISGSSTLDTYNNSDFSNTENHSITFDSVTSDMYVGSASSFNAVGDYSWILRKSADRGVTFTDVFKWSWSTTASHSATLSKIAIKGSRIAAVGFVIDYSNSNLVHWITRLSTDGGVTWNTVRDLTDATHNYRASSVVFDSAGNLYVGGYYDTTASPNTNVSWLIEKSTNNGASWSQLYTYQYEPGWPNYLYDMAITSGDDIIAVGTKYDMTGFTFYHWMTKKITTAGVATDLDDFNYVPGSVNTTAYGVAIKPGTNDIYVVGKGFNGGYAGAVRRSQDAGATWATVYDSGVNGSEIYSITVAADNSVWATGKSSANGIEVLYSPNGNFGTWIDNEATYSGPGGIYAESHGIAANPNPALPNVYVVGLGYDTSGVVAGVLNEHTSTLLPVRVENYYSTGKYDTYASSVAVTNTSHIVTSGFQSGFGSQSWFSRLSTDGGATFSLSDAYQLVMNKNASALDAVTLANGNVLVVGNANDGGGTSHWISRLYDDLSDSWSTTDDYSLAAGEYSLAAAAAVAPNGNVYVGGQGLFAGTANAVIRKSTDNGQTFSTVDTYVHLAGTESKIWAITVDSAGAVWAVGSAFAAGTRKIFLRYSLDGFIFSTRFSATIGSEYETEKAYSIDSDGAGNVYFIRHTYVSEAVAKMYKSTNNGTSFALVSTLTGGAGVDAFLTSFLHDLAGNIFSMLSYSTGDLMVEKIAAGGSNFTTVDTSTSVSNKLVPAKLAMDNGKNILAATYGYSGGHYNLTLKKYTCSY